SDTEVWCGSLVAVLGQVAPPSSHPVAILSGDNSLTGKLAQALMDRSYRVLLHAPAAAAQKKIAELVAALNLMKHAFQAGAAQTLEQAEAGLQANLLVGTEHKTVSVDEALIARAAPGAVLVDGGIGSLAPQAIAAAR